MGTRYTEIRIAIDRFEGGSFSAAGQQGDWLDTAISFEGDLPVRIPSFSVPPRVVVTPICATKFDGKGGFNVMTPICVVRDVTTKGFRLAARNTDPDFGGSYAFNWVAIEESPGVTNPVPALAGGLFPRRHFAPFRESFRGHRTFRDHVFYSVPRDSRSLDTKVASVQVTATDRGVGEHSVAAVGLVHNPFEEDQLDLAAHNVDLVEGGCAFNWATFSYAQLFDASAARTPAPSIETGEVGEAWFEPCGQPGDWRTSNVGFKSPFAEAPVVLMTANKPADIPVRLNPSVIGVAQAVTPHGFRLAARNSDLAPGLVRFHWIAIGAPA
jgi:hypothetical protein